jgi:hypothetical protein
MKKLSVATLIAIAVLFISVSTPVWSVTPQENFQKDKTRSISGLYLAFPVIMTMWANSCGNNDMKTEHSENQAQLIMLAKKLNIVLSPAPNTISDRDSARKAIMRYLMNAWQKAGSYSSELPEQSLNLGLNQTTMMLALTKGKAAISNAEEKAKISKQYDEMIALSKKMGIPKNLIARLETIKSLTLKAKTDAEVIAARDEVGDWHIDLLLAFKKP